MKAFNSINRTNSYLNNNTYLINNFSAAFTYYFIKMWIYYFFSYLYTFLGFLKTYTKTHCITPAWVVTMFFDLYATELRTKIHFSKSDDLSFLSNV